MNTFRLRVEPELIRRASLVWMFVLETYWLTLVLVSTPAPSAASIQFLAVVIGLAIAMAGWRAGAALADGLRVFATLRTPSALWHAWLRKIAVTLATRWALAVIAGTVAVMRHGSSWMWSGPVALYSAVMLVALVAAIAHHGLLHWAWTWLIAAGVAIVIAFAQWHGLAAWMEAAPAGHLALALVCVGATIAALANWRTPPPPAMGRRHVPRNDPIRRVLNHIRRFTVLYPIGTSMSFRKGRGQPAIIVPISLAFMLFSHVMQKTHLGDPAGVNYLFGLLFQMAFIQSSVACKDLHWRHLLAPRRFARVRLGAHLIRSTLELNLGVVAAFAVLAAVMLIVLRWAGMSIGAEAIGHAVLSYGYVFFELLMAVCVAVAMRILRGHMMIYAGALMLAGFFVLWVLTRLGINPYGNFFVIGPAYLGCLLAVSVVATLLANRLWTIERLLPYLATRAPQDDEASARGRWFPWPGRPY
jgi:hypothetical protein